MKRVVTSVSLTFPRGSDIVLVDIFRNRGTVARVYRDPTGASRRRLARACQNSPGDKYLWSTGWDWRRRERNVDG